MPVESRSALLASTSANGTGLPGVAPAAAPLVRSEAPAAGARSSTSEFQAPQVGHLPCHFAVLAPQSEQTWIVWVRAMRQGYGQAGTA